MPTPWTSRVVTGRGAGRTLGFPTLNVTVPPGWPAAPGVYAARVFLAGQWQPAALFFGRAATFGVQAESLELHVLDWQNAFEPAGGQWGTLQFELGAHVRAIRQFGSVAELAAQIAQDVQTVRALWAA